MEGCLRTKIEERLERNIDEYVEEYGCLPETLEVEDDRIVESDEVRGFLDEIADTYDNLLEVDTKHIREDIWENTIYNPSRTDIMKRSFSTRNIKIGGSFGTATAAFLYPLSNFSSPSVFLGTAGLVGLSVMYNNSKDDSTGRYTEDGIGVSKDRDVGTKVFTLQAAETFHEYQNMFDSPTWRSPILCEGAEKYATDKALERKSSESEKWDKQFRLHRIRELSKAYAEIGRLDTGEAEASELKDLGLPDQYVERLSGMENNSEAQEYNLGFGMLVETGEESFPEVFKGDYSAIEEELSEYGEEIDLLLKAKYLVR